MNELRQYQLEKGSPDYHQHKIALDIVDKEIKRRGKANMLKHFKDIKKNKLYTKVNTPKSIDYLINYVSNFNESVNETNGEVI